MNLPSQIQKNPGMQYSSLVLCLCLGLIGVIVSGLFLGETKLPFETIWINATSNPPLSSEETAYHLILWDIRFPRVMLAVLVGFSLGISGAALQGLLRNPLAEPSLIGVSSAAGLGGVIALYFGFASLSIWLLPTFSMIGALVSVFLLFFLTGREASILTIILAGVAISSLAMAVTSFAMNMAPNPWAVTEMLFWLLGSFKDRSMTDITIILPFLIIGWGLLLSTMPTLDLLTLGEETARSMGVNMRLNQFKLILGTALMVGASVAVVGNIGFVGLIIPHLLRPLVAYQPSKLLVVSGLGGAFLLVLADIGVRLLPFRQELNIGVLTALIGAPFFLYLVLKTRRDMR